MDSLIVWGTVEKIKPLLKGLRGVRIINYGFDSIDTLEPVVEIEFNPLKISDLDIFRVISDPETGDGGLANSVGISGKERR